MAGDVQLRWLGAAGIELRLGGHTLVMDPFLTRPSLARLLFGRLRPDRRLIAETIPACDSVLVTHGHYDHVMDVPEVVRRTGAIGWGSPNVCRLMELSEISPSQVREILAGDRFRVGPFQVEVLPAEHIALPGIPVGSVAPRLHPPWRFRHYRMDSELSFLISAGPLRLLNWRSACPGEAARADVLLLMPGACPALYEWLLGEVRPRLAIPVEWDDPFRSLHKPLVPALRPSGRWFPPVTRIDMAHFVHMMEGLGCGVRVLVPERLTRFSLTEL